MPLLGSTKFRVKSWDTYTHARTHAYTHTHTRAHTHTRTHEIHISWASWLRTCAAATRVRFPCEWARNCRYSTSINVIVIRDARIGKPIEKIDYRIEITSKRLVNSIVDARWINHTTIPRYTRRWKISDLIKHVYLLFDITRDKATDKF